MNNLDATVFVFKNKETSEIKATYRDLYMLYANDSWEHVGTLEPRAWIEANWQAPPQEQRGAS
jgi:hypothetical protein